LPAPSQLLFDLRAAQPLAHGHHGGAEYCKSVFRWLVEREGDLHIRAFHDAARPMAQELLDLAARRGVELVRVRSMPDIQRLAEARDVRRLYSALPYDLTSLDLGKLDLVLTVHGLRALEMPTDRYEWKYSSSLRPRLAVAMKNLSPGRYRRRKHGQLSRMFNLPCRRRRFIVPSLHTKSAIHLNFPNVAPSEVIVCYSPRTAVCGHPDAHPQLLQKYGLAPREYVLLVSANRWIKNSYRSLIALDELFARDLGVPRKRVVAVGRAPQSFPRRWRESFLFIPSVDEAELGSLYRHAFALLYPSLNEGFGYPPLESMSYGTPVIASGVTSIPEICGNAVMYSCPYSPQEIQNRLLALLQSPQLWNEYGRRGLARYREVAAQQDHALDELCCLLRRADD
jgi:glycosyltransferase involved in cell wall biosynthesis